MQEQFLNNPNNNQNSQNYYPHNPNYQNPYVPNHYHSPPYEEPVKNPYQETNPYRESGFGEDLNRLKSKQNSKHCQALIATILLIVGITTACVLSLASDVNLSSGGLIGICCGSYVLYLIVGCSCNKLTQYLTNVDKGQNFQIYYDRVRAMVGRFTFHAECYHYETRHHTRTVTNSDGTTRNEHYTTTQKVVTHTATQYLTPYETRDESGKVDRIRANTSIVFIHFYVKYRFNDQQSSMNFQQAYSSFKMRNTRDSHQNFTMGYGVPGLIERKAFYVGDLGCNYAQWFYIFTIIGLIWPYSLWVQSKISRFDVDTMKVLRV